MSRLLRGELRKLLTTRTLFAYAVAGVLMSVFNVVVVTLASGDLDALGEKQEALASLPILLLLLGLVGAAGEYRHRTAAPSALAAHADRGRLLLARTVAYALAGLGIGALMAGVSLAIGLPLLAAHPGPGLGFGDVAPVAAGDVAAAVLFAIMGVAIGALVRNQAAGVIALLLLNFVMNPLVSMADESAGNFTPFGAAAILARMTHDTTLSVGAAGLVLVAWTLPLLAVAIAAERRRDLA
jgi:ABC-2 type transport system permease protein